MSTFYLQRQTFISIHSLIAVLTPEPGAFQPKICTEEKQAERPIVRQHNRLPEHHINLQVHLIVGKLNAALCEEGDRYIEPAWLTTSNPANLLQDL